MTDVKGSRRARYAAMTRGAILDAATQLFVDKGFDATSIDDIARRSESSKGSVYHHFTDKREIFAEVFRSTELTVISRALLSAPTEGTPSDRIRGATTAFLRNYADDPTARALLRQVMGVLGWERVRAIDDEIALPAIRAAMSKLLHTADDTAVVHIPVDTAAEMLFGLYCNGILHIAAAENPELAAREVEAVILAMLNGLHSAAHSH